MYLASQGILDVLQRQEIKNLPPIACDPEKTQELSHLNKYRQTFQHLENKS